MKAAWEELGGEFVDSKSVIIGDMDCTVHKDTCGKMGVRGYPTIKYFTSSTAADGDKYEGGRDLEALKKFASESLGPSCAPDNRDLCKPEQIAVLDAAAAMSSADRAAFIEEKEKTAADAEETFKKEVELLQANYKKLMEDKDAAVAEAGKDLGLYRAVHTASGHDEL